MRVDWCGIDKVEKKICRCDQFNRSELRHTKDNESSIVSVERQDLYETHARSRAQPVSNYSQFEFTSGEDRRPGLDCIVT